MNRFFTGVALATLITASATAADLGPAAKAPRFATAFDWTGFYVGGHAGWLSGTSSVTDEGYYDSGATNVINADGFAGGGQVGYNWQSGSVVYGIEADGSFVGAKRSYLGYYALYSTDWKAVGTIRGRVGLTVDRTMAYVTAGGAWADVVTRYNTNVPSGGGNGDISGNGRWGWTAGVGVEHAWTDAWSFKLEALYLRLVDGDSQALPPPQTCSTSGNVLSHPCNFKFDHDAWTVRLGLYYRFGGGARNVY